VFDVEIEVADVLAEAALEPGGRFCLAYYYREPVGHLVLREHLASILAVLALLVLVDRLLIG